MAAVLSALLCVPALAADADGGAPPPRRAPVAAPVPARPALVPTTDGGAPAGDGGIPPAADGGPAAPAPDAGSPTPETAAPAEPVVRIPPTLAEQSEGLPIATMEIVGNRRVGR
ncbi:MAG TPA: hypothetical protein VIF09_23470, partial [Polyangiaceae bacterium]